MAYKREGVWEKEKEKRGGLRRPRWRVGSREKDEGSPRRQGWREREKGKRGEEGRAPMDVVK